MELAFHYSPDFKIDDKLSLCKYKESEEYFLYLKLDKFSKPQDIFKHYIIDLINKNIQNFEKSKKVITRFCKTSKVKLYYDDLKDFTNVPVNFFCFPINNDIQVFIESTDIDGLKKKEEVSFENFRNILKPGIKIKLLLKINFQDCKEDYSDLFQINQIIIKKSSDVSIFMPILFGLNSESFTEASTSINLKDDMIEEEIKETTDIKSINNKTKKQDFQNAELIETNIDGFIFPESYN